MHPAALLPLLLLPPLAAQQVEAYRETAQEIMRRAAADGEAYEKLVSLCTVAPHRLSGSPGAAAAVEWARQAMEADGLENVRLEAVMVPRWERGSRCLVALAETGERLAAIALGGSIATEEGGISAEVVEVSSVEAVAELGEAVHGRIVFFNRPLDGSLFDPFEAYGGAVDQRGSGPAAAAAAGAVAVVVRSMSTRTDDVPHTGAMRQAAIPAAAISTLAADLLSSKLRRGESVRLHIELDCRWLTDVPSYNVIGELVGTESPDEIVLVGGHLDAWDVGQGAHDDGAGCVQSIEALRLLRSLGLRPRRTLRAVLFMNEENGGRGALAYRAAHAQEVPGHVFALESDRGGYSPRGITTNAQAEAWAVLESIMRLLAPAGAGEIHEGGGGADIDVLEDDGVVLASLFTDPQRYFDLHHSARDTIEQVNERELNLGAGLIAAVSYIVADLEEPLPRRPVDEP